MKSSDLASTVLAVCLALGLVLGACSDNGGDNDGGPDACDGCGDGDDGPQTCSGIAECPTYHLCIGGFCQIGTVCTGSGEDECPAGYTCSVMKEVCIPENLCASDPDCAAADPATPHCLVGDGVCVECTEHAHCGDPAEVECNDSFECEPIGPDCTTHTECLAADSSRPYCDQVQGKCFACVSHDHCAPQVCEPVSRTCMDCYDSNHCLDPFPHCYTSTRTCVECLIDAHCGADEHCNPSTHTCTDIICESNDDCLDEPGPHCDVDTGDCVACLDHVHCGALQWCRDHICQSGCTTDQECVDKLGADHRCNDTGQCFFAECQEDADCAVPNLEHCKLDAVPSNPQQYTCVQCTDDAHCAEYFWCKKGSGQFFCEPMPCYQYPDPEATCAEIDPCYVCDYGIDGQCMPRENECEYLGDGMQSDCCRGYHCNSARYCNLNDYCDTNEDCPVGYECTAGNFCEYQSICGDCLDGWFCNEQTEECEQGECKQILENCNSDIQNCCPGLRCAAFFGLCFQA